jgi:hypothetical protein
VVVDVVHRHLGVDIDPEELDFDDPLRHAAIYPETVALTSLLVVRFGATRPSVLGRRSGRRSTASSPAASGATTPSPSSSTTSFVST